MKPHIWLTHVCVCVCLFASMCMCSVRTRKCVCLYIYIYIYIVPHLNAIKRSQCLSLRIFINSEAKRKVKIEYVEKLEKKRGEERTKEDRRREEDRC